MSIERTFSIVKPDAVRRNLIGKIYERFESGGLQLLAARMIHLTRAQAQEFYGVHRERPFYNDLVEYMISGPVMVQVLEGENAIARNREIMGATNPADAALGTIRADFARDVSRLGHSAASVDQKVHYQYYTYYTSTHTHIMSRMLIAHLHTHRTWQPQASFNPERRCKGARALSDHAMACKWTRQGSRGTGMIPCWSEEACCSRALRAS